MSRPGPVIGSSGSEASARISRSRPAGSSAPLRVTADRLTPEEARAAQLAEAERRSARSSAGVMTASAVRAPAVSAPAMPAAEMWGPASSVSGAPGAPAPRPGAAVAPVAAPGLPVPLGLPPRRSGLSELLALITGRRRTGRHRPDCVSRQPWSMFSPGRRPRRRGRFRSRV